LADASDRYLAQQLRDVGPRAKFEAPAWKKQILGKNVAYGKLTSKTLKEQKELLPIYAFKYVVLSKVN